MGAVGSTVLTLADWAKRLNPDGTQADVIDLMSQTNEMVQDALA